jgi:hypothetical protein
MSLNAGTAGMPRPGAAKKKGGRFKWFLLLFLLIFGAGIYTGIYAARRAATGPAWVQAVFNHLPGIPAAPAPAPMPLAAAPAPSLPQTDASAPAPQPVPNPSSAPPAVTGQTPSSVNSAPSTTPPEFGENFASPKPSQPETTETSEDPAAQLNRAQLDRQVKEYNALLRRLQEAQKNYEAGRQLAKNSQASPQQRQAGLEKEIASLEEFRELAREAQAKYDILMGSEGISERYVEKEPALTSERAPRGVTEVNVSGLRFLRPRE